MRYVRYGGAMGPKAWGMKIGEGWHETSRTLAVFSPNKQAPHFLPLSCVGGVSLANTISWTKNPGRFRPGFSIFVSGSAI